MLKSYTNYPLSDINITNLVDVALTLLVIFIMVAPLMYHGIELQLPRVSSKGLDLKKEYVVTIDHKKNIYLNDKKTNLTDLNNKLKTLSRTNPDTSVYLKADKRLNLGFAVEVIGMIKNAGIENLGIVTEPGGISKWQPLLKTQ